MYDKKQRLVSLKLAMHCIRVMKKIGTYDDHRIGVVVEDVGGMVITYKKGDVVIYRRDFEMIFGEKKLHKTVTVEQPISRKWMRENLKKRNLIMTVSTIVCVPDKLVVDIKDMGCEWCLDMSKC